ncbi:conserved hypothetical protein [Ricinus communis]|uniref:Uncharacterized protein n=1 Tax=Ricinus communis TaxID=3988 RepID=B9SZA8_RICCO|nr:conserved hypothetical protein [Ricinus communis]
MINSAVEIDPFSSHQYSIRGDKIPKGVLKRIDDDVLINQELFLAVDAIKKHKTPSKVKRFVIGWQPSSVGDLKWNVDGSALGKQGPTGVSGVLTDHTGNILCLFSINYGVLDSNVVEVVAIGKALQLSASKPSINFSNLIIESNSLNAILWQLNLTRLDLGV